MFQSFFTETYKKISPEEMQTILKTPEKYIMIHTLTSEYQDYYSIPLHKIQVFNRFF